MGADYGSYAMHRPWQKQECIVVCYAFGVAVETLALIEILWQS